ncbi:MAG: phosphocholine cytidylyltransferase family protein [Firmicutes bacterium]|nr:phosphocholine cytidylyltransferase family protein [Bacillota bacterium]
MKAVILAAGIGSRLRPITDNTPKTLVKVNGKPIINYILDAIQSVGIYDVIICNGYKAAKLVNHCRTYYPDINFIFVENKEYDSTNNMYSFYLAKDYLDDDIILMNADVVFDKDILKGMILQHNTMVAVERGRYLGESMKIIVEQGIIKGISKEFSAEQSYGTSIDIYKIMKDDLECIKNEMYEIIEIKNEKTRWTEVMLNNLFNNGELIAFPYDIFNKKWVEIDNYMDLMEAEKLFGEEI